MEIIHLVSVNMGYGHQRTAFPLKCLAKNQKIIQANDYPEIPEKDRRVWETTRKFYEAVSRFKKVPLIGEFAFFLFNQSQKIFSFYPKRDLSKPNIQVKQVFSLIRKGWGKHLIEKLKIESQELKTKPPIVSTFFIPAFMAEYFNYPGDIFCVICDTDISRAWASFNPQKSRIKYFASTERVMERLKLYGVKESNIFFTGYPLPLENIGSEKLEILKNDLKERLLNLDPKKRFFKNYRPLIEKHLGKLPQKPDRPLTIMFSVGGAGVQKEIGLKIVRQLHRKIKKREVKILLSVGIKRKIKEYFKKNTKGLGVEIIFSENIEDYFIKFNQALRQTDILWTKPSELSFYSALGVPIIITSPVGSQEEFNKRWLLKSGFGLSQEDLNHLNQWLFDWLNQGYLAEAAMEGFIEGEKLGTIKIKEIIKGRRDKSLLPLRPQIGGLGK